MSVANCRIMGTFLCLMGDPNGLLECLAYVGVSGLAGISNPGMDGNGEHISGDRGAVIMMLSG